MFKPLFTAALAATLITACATQEKAAPPAPAPAAPPAPVRSLTQLKGDVYRWQNDQHFGVVLVTSDGIVIADPINKAASEWLKSELTARFPDKAVKYVLYSHKDFDHASGAGVFSDARVISQEDTKKLLQPPAADAPITGFVAGLDTSKDGKLQKSEVANNPFFGPQWDNYDADKNGEVTALELFKVQFADVRPPDGTFKNDYTLKLGGQSVRMIHVGGSHSSDMSFIVFPGNILFVVDVISLKRVPFGTLADYNESELDGFIVKAKSLNPEIITGGHGAVGTVADLDELKQYYVDLIDGVKAGIAAGKTLEQIQAELTLDKYKDWANYQMRPQNISGIYAKLTAKN
jgi:glyoxylase-like metal-dependent hydrolase (beta-lactamase superfamily II)